MRNFIVAILFWSGAPACFAQNEPMIALFGIGTLHCGDVLQTMEKNNPAERVYGAWLQGYISGRNQERINRNEEAGAGSGTTIDTLIAALKIQCQKNVFAPLYGAANGIYEQPRTGIPSK